MMDVDVDDVVAVVCCGWSFELVGWMDVKMSGTMGMPMAPVAVN